jgi:sec-independent protein translocase protein TatA
MVGDIFQPTHLLFVLVIALLVLGPKRLPEVARQLGKGLRDFRAAINGERSDHEEELDAGRHHDGAEPEPYQAPPQPVEHQFAHDTTQPAPEQHQFAQDTTQPLPEQHQFAHDTTQPAPEQHQFAHAPPDPGESTHQPAHEDPAQAPAHDADAGPARPAGEHEFAYEPARPAEKPVDPHT